jgi:hypothetical protein
VKNSVLHELRRPSKKRFVSFDQWIRKSTEKAMIGKGEEYWESMHHGREVYINGDYLTLRRYFAYHPGAV